MSGRNYQASKEERSLIAGRRMDDPRFRDEEYSSADSESPVRMTNQNVTSEHPCSQEISPTSLGRKRKREIIHEYSMGKLGHKRQLDFHSNMTETQINESNKTESGDSIFVIAPQFEQSQHEPLDQNEAKDYTKVHSSLNVLDDALAVPGPSYYTCHSCNETFDNQSLLETHYGSHSAEKSLRSNVCEQMYSVKSSHNSPVLAHSEKVTYKCDECDKVYTQKGRLKTHYRIHIDNAEGSKHCGSSAEKKTFQCDMCPKIFSRKSNFTIHYRKHTGEKPQQCTKCNIRFSSPSNLKKHRQFCKCSSESD